METIGERNETMSKRIDAVTGGLMRLPMKPEADTSPTEPLTVITFISKDVRAEALRLIRENGGDVHAAVAPFRDAVMQNEKFINELLLSVLADIHNDVLFSK